MWTSFHTPAESVLLSNSPNQVKIKCRHGEAARIVGQSNSGAVRIGGKRVTVGAGAAGPCACRCGRRTGHRRWPKCSSSGSKRFQRRLVKATLPPRETPGPCTYRLAPDLLEFVSTIAGKFRRIEIANVNFAVVKNPALGTDQQSRVEWLGSRSFQQCRYRLDACCRLAPAQCSYRGNTAVFHEQNISPSHFR